MSRHELDAYVNGEIVAELWTSDCAQGAAVRVGARRGARAGAWSEALNQRRDLGRCATAVGARTRQPRR